jgi:Cd2+/Zn2+-exporting ATPase
MINSDGVLRCVTRQQLRGFRRHKDHQNGGGAREKKGRTETLNRPLCPGKHPVVILLAALLAFGPPLLFSQSLRVWLAKAAGLFGASCPCALVISIPLTFYAGVGAILSPVVAGQGQPLSGGAGRRRLRNFGQNRNADAGIPRVRR